MCEINKCPRCESPENVKYGTNASGTAKLKCKNCAKVFTINPKIKRISNEQGIMIIDLYLERMGIRAIGRVLKISNVGVLQFIRRYAKKIKEAMPAPAPTHRAEADEMYLQFRKKKRRLDVVGSVLFDG